MVSALDDFAAYRATREDLDDTRTGTAVLCAILGQDACVAEYAGTFGYGLFAGVAGVLVLPTVEGCTRFVLIQGTARSQIDTKVLWTFTAGAAHLPSHGAVTEGREWRTTPSSPVLQNTGFDSLRGCAAQTLKLGVHKKLRKNSRSSQLA